MVLNILFGLRHPENKDEEKIPLQTGNTHLSQYSYLEATQ